MASLLPPKSQIVCARCLDLIMPGTAHTTVHHNRVARVCPPCGEWIRNVHVQMAEACDGLYVQQHLLLHGDLHPWAN